MDRDTPPRAPAPSREAPSLTSIGYLLHMAQSRLRDGVVAALEGSGLHPGQLGVLGALHDGGPMSQKRLGEFTLIEKSTLVLFIDALEGAGWVVRVKDPADRRANLVQLTVEGERKFHGLGPGLVAAQDALLAPLGAEERRMLADLLSRIGWGPNGPG